MTEETAGMSRVRELENVLGVILDTWEQPYHDEGWASDMDDLVERGQVVLSREEEDLDPEEIQ